MIYKNEDGTNVMEFGRGDIEVAAGHMGDATGDPCICFIAQDPAPIGVVSKQSLDKHGECPVLRTDVHTIFVFTNPKSIDVIIDKLLQIKVSFNKAL